MAVIEPEVRSMPRTGRVVPVLFFIAILTGLYVWVRIALPVLTLQAKAIAPHQDHLPMVLSHALGGTCMLVAGAAALYIGWTRRFFRGHKIFGYVYLIGGFMGAIAALILILSGAHPSVVIGSATGTLAAVWLAVAGMAYRAIRNRRFEVHREWMIRSYVLTWTFVFCRIVMGSSLMPGSSDADIGAVIWTTWVVPMVICELVLQWSRTSRASSEG
jgi:Predicted membrane protein (DUF2306)